MALVLLRHTLGSLEKLRACQGMYETMEQLRSLPPQCMQEDFLVHEVSPGQDSDSPVAGQPHRHCIWHPFLHPGDEPASDRSTD